MKNFNHSDSAKVVGKREMGRLILELPGYGVFVKRPRAAKRDIL